MLPPPAASVLIPQLTKPAANSAKSVHSGSMARYYFPLPARIGPVALAGFGRMAAVLSEAGGRRWRLRCRRHACASQYGGLPFREYIGIEIGDQPVE